MQRDQDQQDGRTEITTEPIAASPLEPLLDASVLRACACLLSTKEETRTLRALAPAWSRSSWLTSRGPHEVCLALISPPLASLPSKAALEEVLCLPPHEAWPLVKVLNALLMKMGRTGLLAKPRRGLQAGKSGDPHSQNTDIRSRYAYTN